MRAREKYNQKYMLRAIELAKKGLGKTFPNPAVGCVIVKGKKIVAEGFHRRFGAVHAEIEALNKAGLRAKGACLYVNLEPCTHFGKTPPCVKAIIKSGIKEVIIGMRDPNFVNNGKGINILRTAGIKVKEKFCEKKAQELNAHFIKYISRGLPYVTLKIAQSLDGKIATRTGDSKWISSEDSRCFVHKLRRQADAVMIGAGTAVRDDPLLTTRTPHKQPVKIIIDSKLRTPLDLKIFSKKSPAKTIIATTNLASKMKIKQFLKKNVDILPVNSKNGKVNLKVLMKILANRGISNIMIEGGGELTASALKVGIVDKILFFIAPKIIGGRGAKTPVEGEGIKKVTQALNVKNLVIKKIGCDFLFEGEL